MQEILFPPCTPSMRSLRTEVYILSYAYNHCDRTVQYIRLIHWKIQGLLKRLICH
jgi:hypothetical protein